MFSGSSWTTVTTMGVGQWAQEQAEPGERGWEVNKVSVEGEKEVVTEAVALLISYFLPAATHTCASKIAEIVETCHKAKE